jgi:hypothetical protein
MWSTPIATTEEQTSWNTISVGSMSLSGTEPRHERRMIRRLLALLSFEIDPGAH